MILNGIDIDDPRIFGTKKYDYKEYTEGSRTKIKSLWVDSWTKENGSMVYEAHLLKMTNRGAMTLDDKPIKDKKEQNEVKDIFNNINFV